MSADDSVTVAIAALNEEQAIAAAVDAARDAAAQQFADYEVIIFDDGSTDATGRIADDLAAADPHVLVVHHRQPKNRGGIYKAAIEMARNDYLILIDGTADSTVEDLTAIFSVRDRADLIVPYIDQDDRAGGRKRISRLFVSLCNGLFHLRLRYYNHSVLCRTDLLAPIRIRTSSYAFQAEVLIKLIKSGCSYVQVPRRDDWTFKDPGKTSAFKLRNVLGTAGFFLATWWDVYMARQPQQLAAQRR